MEVNSASCAGSAGSSPPSSKRTFHADDPLIVMAGTNRKNKKIKVGLPRNATEETTANVKVESDEGSSKVEPIINARSYQKTILANALRENTIAYLETGCGKTLIAILLIKEMASCMRERNERFRAVFMAPTVCLVMQQTSVLKINLDLQVECYYGARGVDKWSYSTWKQEMDANEVFVMTPMVLLDAVRHGFLSLSSFQLLIFDECHRALKKHPYAKIMREHYHNVETESPKPRIFGMTASPVTSKGVASAEDSALQMQQLETLLDCKVCTVGDDTEVQHYLPNPNQKIRLFSAPTHSFPSVLQELECLLSKQEVAYASAVVNGIFYKDVEELNKKLCRKLKRLHGCILYSLEELGLLCAYESALCLLKKIKSDGVYKECEDQRVQSSKEAYLSEARDVLGASLVARAGSINNTDDVLAAVNTGLLSPKVFLLVKCLLEYQHTENFRCIVFVERVVTAMVLAKIIGKVGCLSFVRSTFLSGAATNLDVMGKRHQHNTMAQFHSGQLNVLVATDVAEEGIDVQKCSSVIRFDLSKTVRSFIQSRGRARMPGSDYIIFLEEHNQKQLAQLSDLKQGEESMKCQALNRTHFTVPSGKCQSEELEVFVVQETGAMVSIDSSVSLISRFCANLPGDTFYRPAPQFVFEDIKGDESNHVCKLILPPNGPFRELIGPPRQSRIRAKQSVCLEACKMLYALGQLTDHLIPVVDVEKPEEEEVMNLSGKDVAGVGTSKRKELHGTVRTQALFGDWINSQVSVSLHAYLVCFEFYQREEDPYINFVMLLKAALDDDIANTEFPLYLSNNRKAKAKFFDVGVYSLSAGQLEDAKAYHQLIFNGMFGKLIRRRDKKLAKLSTNDVLACNNDTNISNQLWDSSQMYLVLPLLSCQMADEAEEVPINWKAVRDAASTARLFKHLCTTKETWNLTNERKPSHGNAAVLQMALGSMPASQLVGMAVVTIHTGRIYSVVDVLDEKHANCPIEGEESSEYTSYSHYFAEKYKRMLKFPEQPLLRVKQTHRIHNLLTQDVTLPMKKESTRKVANPALVELPAELCLCTGLPSALVRSLYLFPSVFHRLNALLLAAQLRSVIAKDVPPCKSIPGTVVMQALTTLRCLEGFSFEGLELLGDSFLKYAVSRYLYLVYERKHEGQLSNRRCRLICNKTLHHLALLKHLPGYIRDEPFQPECWKVPGMLSTKSVGCKCNLENLTTLADCSEGGNGKTGGIFRIGKACSQGHRWMCSKTVSDAVEALIGAFVSCGDTGPAVGFMKWIGMNIDFDLSLYEAARNRKIHPKVLNAVNVASIESQLGYVFLNKALVIEALTHASKEDPHDAYDVLSGGCYQRLEFLGDAVLDFLITRHLFMTHPGLSPGVLSDLRSAAVNNDCFARSVVKHNLQRYLRHGSGELLLQITNFVKAVEAANEACQAVVYGWEGVGGPKVLGDLLESIAGAILVDSGFDLDTVWSVMARILSPLVTPATLPLHPIRELHELTQSKGFSFAWKKTPKFVGTEIEVTGQVNIGNEVITETATAQLRKTARKNVAQKMIFALKRRGILHPRKVAETKNAASISPSHSDEKRTFDDDGCASNEKRRRLVFDGHVGEVNTFLRDPLALDSAIFQESSLKCKDSEERTCRDINVEVKFQDSEERTWRDINVKVECNSNPKDKKGSTEADIVPVQNFTKTTEELETSTNLKMSLTESRSEDETSAFCAESPYIANPLIGERLQENLQENHLQTSKSFISQEKVLGLGDTGVLSIMLMDKGVGRSKLYELCLKKKWPMPKFTVSVEAVDSKHFVSTAAVECPHGLFQISSDPMPRKDRAKDNAAAQLFVVLSQYA